MEIVRLVEKHFKEVSRLNLSVHKLHVEWYPEIFKELSEAELEKCLRDYFDDKTAGGFTAFIEGEVAGYVLFRRRDHEENSFQKARSFLYIDQIGVREDLRGRGTGKALLDEVKSEALKMGDVRLALEVWANNKNAQSFFRSEGFAPFCGWMVFEG